MMRTTEPSPSLPDRVRVLVVEDDVDTADSFGLLLRLWGFDVRTCHRGRDALNVVGEFRPQIVFLDLALPGMDGFEVARRLRHTTPGKQALVVAMTGYAEEEYRLKATGAGCDWYFTKPLELAELRDLLFALQRDPKPERPHWQRRPTEESPMPQGQPIRSLIAVSNKSLRESYRAHFASEGFAVLTATNALVCLAHLRRWVPDFLVLEDGLPWGGAAGILALMEESDVPTVPVVLLYCGDLPVAAHYSAIHACLRKPVDPGELAWAVQSQVVGCLSRQHERVRP
jgi:DNA-binding response OmpR family regulator